MILRFKSGVKKFLLFSQGYGGKTKNFLRSVQSQKTGTTRYQKFFFYSRVKVSEEITKVSEEIVKVSEEITKVSEGFMNSREEVVLPNAYPQFLNASSLLIYSLLLFVKNERARCWC